MEEQCSVNKVNYIDGILGYACSCPRGNRTVGACCHVAAIIYYLASGRYESRIIRPSEILTTLFSSSPALEDIIIGEGNEEESLFFSLFQSDH